VARLELCRASIICRQPANQPKLMTNASGISDWKINCIRSWRTCALHEVVPSRYWSIEGNVNDRFLTIVWTSAREIRRSAFDKPKDEGEANGWLIDEAKSNSYCRVRRWIDQLSHKASALPFLNILSWQWLFPLLLLTQSRRYPAS
jgi:hypothetical protein